MVRKGEGMGKDLLLCNAEVVADGATLRGKAQVEEPEIGKTRTKGGH